MNSSEFAACAAGAAGYLSKDMELASLPRALRGSLDGEAAISRRLAMHLRSSTTGPLRRVGWACAPCARRSRIASGRSWTFCQAARGPTTSRACFVLSTETVRSHLKNLYRKLEVRSRDEAVEAAVRMRELGGALA